jgi:hypothetical protein
MQFSFIFLNIIFLYLAAQLGGPRSSVVDYVNVLHGRAALTGEPRLFSKPAISSQFLSH